MSRRGLDRRYGFFECPECSREWESSHVYCYKGTNQAAYKQECTDCKIMTDPYKIEKLICSRCGSQACTCTDYEKMERKRNIDLAKPHRSDLCEKCKKGMPCYR
ncbi:hypothetical protein KUTeg_018028 [Tegillarca granosa]|uniref:3CxxC-type domain-containing protein n=1 Tax=Tegillarca granosa TaxID=220873 RepID=A0ABQ9EGW5_TEGGR|nr:hypothetical protein KUTeg_018028 [Tegillarca granosa]